MEKLDLDELVGIWERWTSGDRLLYRALHGRGGVDSPAHRYLWEQLFLRINLLTRQASAPNAGALAASLAASAVFLALEDKDTVRHEQWHRIRYGAYLAHQEALTAVAQADQLRTESSHAESTHR